jgi:hypothetical protein
MIIVEFNSFFGLCLLHVITNAVPPRRGPHQIEPSNESTISAAGLGSIATAFS